MGHGNKEEGHECGCGHDHCEEGQEYTVEDLAYSAHNRLDALIELLIAKKAITEQEYETKIEEIMERELDESEDDDSEDSEENADKE